jgi:hypothetical protein
MLGKFSVAVLVLLLGCPLGAFIDHNSAHLGPSEVALTEISANVGTSEGGAASLGYSVEVPPRKLRQASLYTKKILQDPENWARLEAMAKNIKYTAPLRYQVPLLMSALHRVLGPTLDTFGINDGNIQLLFSDLNEMSLTDPDVGAWVDRIAGLVQSEHASGSSLYGAAALPLTREEAGKVLDECLAILTTPANSKKLKAEVMISVHTSDPASYMLDIMASMVGDQLSKYGIKAGDLQSAISHLRSWAVMDSHLRPKMEKVLIALGGNILQ